MMGWYLMYWLHPRVHSGAMGRHRFIEISGLPEAFNRETRARAGNLARSIWSAELARSADGGETISSPYLVWRWPLEIEGDDLTGVVPVATGAHTPDETAEYEFHEYDGSFYDYDGH